MKTIYAAAALATLAVSAPAFAQQSSFAPISGYGTLGYSYLDNDGPSYGAVTGRLGALFGRYLGVEGELSGGLQGDTVSVNGVNVKTKANSQVAAYGVGFLPVSPNLDLIARVGYGDTDVKAKAPNISVAGGNSWNYGVGAQYLFDEKNGVRGDYTRYDYNDGGAANVWSVAYIRKF